MEKLNKLTPYERLAVVRHKGRPTIRDYIPLIFDEFIELHGDRYFGDDKAIMGGIASINGVSVTVVANVKGRNIAENKECNFAMPNPEGYRKALRLAKQAEKFHRPLICFIDTPGAFAGIDAEKRGQGEAIARNIMEFMRLRTPIISVILGEAGSGGALALGVCDELAVLENSLYSAISPRGFASILWKDAGKEKEACSIMKITAEDMVELGIAEKIIEEPLGGAHNDIGQTAENIAEFLYKSLNKKMGIALDVLLNERYTKFRKVGEFIE